MLASETRKLAREALTGKWGKAALLTLVYVLIVYVVTFVLNLIPVIGPIAQVVIEIPIAFGFISTLIKLKRGEEVSYIGFITDGFNSFASSWKVALWTLVKMLIPVIVLVVAMVALIMSASFAGVMSVTNHVQSASGWGILSVIFSLVLVAASIWVTIKSYSYQLVYYLLFDNPTKDAKEIVEESESLMNGNRWRLFCLELSFIGWMILASFTFGIGMLWLVPYMAVAQIVFYEVLAGKKSDTVEAPVQEAPAEPVQEDNGPISEA